MRCKVKSEILYTICGFRWRTRNLYECTSLVCLDPQLHISHRVAEIIVSLGLSMGRFFSLPPSPGITKHLSFLK